ncbi:hypothetical protein KUV85_12245 [Nocardioides panacisoli]|uniref:hypothetical protein n=1 Tax=Nocardioides panacisoli TaxID=627624 RepID=UPI001C62FBD6|nr:hypothetical protein [Nocardioides panacisoli]QYJ03103.1 hypothetical protein KUV85_12245 [Nocardioides panacisoli]
MSENHGGDGPAEHEHEHGLDHDSKSGTSASVDDPGVPVGERCQLLQPGDGGRWLVTTQGSTHIWDLDAWTYTRMPGAHSRSGAFVQDQVANPITRVERWPRVNKASLVWFNDATHPHYVEQWRQSSTIVSIERLPDRPPPRAPEIDEQGRVVVANGALGGVHPSGVCAENAWGCWIHRPLPHPLDHAPVYWREDKSTAERHCSHGIGHPDPQDSAYAWFVHGRDVTVHACDGCCRPGPAWLKDLW